MSNYFFNSTPWERDGRVNVEKLLIIQMEAGKRFVFAFYICLGCSVITDCHRNIYLKFYTRDVYVSDAFSFSSIGCIACVISFQFYD